VGVLHFCILFGVSGVLGIQENKIGVAFKRSLHDSLVAQEEILGLPTLTKAFYHIFHRSDLIMLSSVVGESTLSYDYFII
jgi:hypothetical protein